MIESDAMLFHIILIIQIGMLLFYVCYLLINILKNYFELAKLKMIDKNDKEKFKYYRDILKDYSIGELGYIFNNKNVNKLIIAELESLKMKKILDIKDKNILITNDNKNISESEKYILEHYKFIKEKQFKINYLKCIETSLKEKNCLKNYKWKFSDKLNIAFILYVFSFLLGYYLALKYALSDNVTFFAIEMIMFLITIIVVGISMKVYDVKNKMVKTSIGKDIYLKLNGLKKYIKDFGNFEERNLKEIALWEEYILYAIILNESKTLTEQAKEEYLNLVNIVY